MAIIVSDTSPVRALAHLGLLGLLEQLYGQVIVPEAVAAELREEREWFGPLDVGDYPFFVVRKPGDTGRARAVSGELHAGEIEALSLALEMEADALLMDERAGRAAAAQLGIRVVGALGVLIAAKRAGKVQSVGPLMRRLIAELDFRVAPDIQAAVLNAAGE